MQRIAAFLLVGFGYILFTAIIALVVFELRDEGESSVNMFGQSTEWVACQVLITNDEIERQQEPEGILLTSQISDRIHDECGAPSDAWVLCVHQEFTALSDPELLDFGTDTAADIANKCEDKAAVEEALQQVVLQPEDLPEGTVRGDESFTTNGELAAASADPEARRAELEAWGRILGFEVTYEPSGAPSTARPVRGVNVSASLYETEDGAADSFADAVKTAEETDWQANYPGLRDFQQDEIGASGAADEIMWLRLSGVQSALDGDDELVTDDLIFFREARERGFLRVQALSSETDDRAHYARTVEGWLATLVENVKNALAELGDGE